MKYLFAAFILSLMLTGCGKKSKTESISAEDTRAKAMLAGVWVDADEGDVVFKVKGDSIFYPDSASRAVRFAVYADTLVMYGSTVSKYKILRQEKHLFEFKTPNGDIIKIVKSNDPYDAEQFDNHSHVTLNQGQLIKRDTVVALGDSKYHCYVQVNPTSYKVFRASYNEEGLEVDRVYYDNIIHISVYKGASKVFSRDFRKADFSSVVPETMLEQCVLSDMLLSKIDEKGVHYITQLAIPDSPSSFIVNLVISYQGRFSINVKE